MPLSAEQWVDLDEQDRFDDEETWEWDGAHWRMVPHPEPGEESHAA